MLCESLLCTQVGVVLQSESRWGISVASEPRTSGAWRFHVVIGELTSSPGGPVIITPQPQEGTCVLEGQVTWPRSLSWPGAALTCPGHLPAPAGSPSFGAGGLPVDCSPLPVLLSLVPEQLTGRGTREHCPPPTHPLPHPHAQVNASK